jgi:hypothetical protein
LMRRRGDAETQRQKVFSCVSPFPVMVSVSSPASSTSVSPNPPGWADIFVHGKISAVSLHCSPIFSTSAFRKFMIYGFPNGADGAILKRFAILFGYALFLRLVGIHLTRKPRLTYQQFPIRKVGLIWSFLLPALAGRFSSWQGNQGFARRRTKYLDAPARSEN